MLNVPCALEKREHSAVAVPHMSVRSSRQTVLFKSSTTLLSVEASVSTAKSQVRLEFCYCCH